MMKGEITISRDSRNVIRISIVDELSRERFVTFSMTPTDFCMALTGLAYVEGDLSVSGLDCVGKKKITESRSIDCPIASYDAKTLEAWLIENAQEPGWILYAALRSQGSVIRLGDKTTLNYSVYRYEEVCHD
jgi:hypothetical protein